MGLNKDKILQVLQLLIINSLFISAASAQINNDTTSLNEKANQEIRKSILSKPPNISIAIYINGKVISKSYTVNLIVNGINVKEAHRKNIKLDTSKFNNGDSLVFLLRYKKGEVYSEKFSFKRFIHGGSLIAGFISDYAKEKEKFVLDETTYLKNNQKNKLYDLIIRTKKSDKGYLEKKYQLGYSIVQSNITPLVSFKYNFISNYP